MERQIKFRVWDDNSRAMITEPAFIEIDGFGRFNVFLEDFAQWVKDAHEDKAGFILHQFTGLHDKDGKEVYEGDIVNLHIFTQELGYNMGVREGEKIFKGVIEFWEYGLALNVGDDENNFYLVLAPGMLHEESFEILGSIHTHPELLTTKND